MDLDSLTIPDLQPPRSASLFSSQMHSLLRVPTPPPVPRLVPSSRPRPSITMGGAPPTPPVPPSQSFPSMPPPAPIVDCTATAESAQVLGTWSARRAPAVEIVISLRCDRTWAVALAGLALVVLVATVALVIRVS
jgi:hypothetical protein